MQSDGDANLGFYCKKNKVWRNTYVTKKTYAIIQARRGARPPDEKRLFPDDPDPRHPNRIFSQLREHLYKASKSSDFKITPHDFRLTKMT